jgi:hypothetical protein
MSSSVEDYKVYHSAFIGNGETISGRFAIADGDSMFDLVDAIEALGNKAAQGVIGIIPSEYRYSRYEDSGVLEELAEDANLACFLTFGTSNDSKQHVITSHLSKVIYEFEIPTCFARKPKQFAGHSRKDEANWLKDHSLNHLQGKRGSLALSANGRAVRLARQK